MHFCGLKPEKECEVSKLFDNKKKLEFNQKRKIKHFRFGKETHKKKCNKTVRFSMYP